MSSSFDFDYSLPEFGSDVAAGALGIVTGFLLLFGLLMLAFGIVSYVLQGVSFYRIAKRRGIHNAWLAWIPIGVYWLMGSISDHYQYVAKQKVTNRRRILLVLGIVTSAMSIIYSVMQLSTTLAFTADAGMGNEIGMVAVGVLVYLVWLGVAIATSVFMYIALYDLYRSCKPGSAVLFLVLGIVFSVAIPFFLIICSNSDEGMPPKRVPQRPVQPAYIPEAQAEPAPAPAAEEPAAEEIPVVETQIVEESQ